ncbi:MAG: aldo/keto reductase [Alphaproteobacteria bacterium]|nr:aldo/keto reductase [Alphaproteobacteria bacterium]
MERRLLGNSDIAVSPICLGTMTWGCQNTEAEGHAQLDFALDHGINFIDTAEMYPVPRRAETQGATERIIGSWLSSRRNRDQVVLATKIIGGGGGGRGFSWIRNGQSRPDRANIAAAVESSLKRLQTDYIDLYYIHWPDRTVPSFGGFGYVHYAEEVATPLQETLDGLQEQVKAGKIRAIGLSNETPWGVMTCLKAHETSQLPRVQAVQNLYNLLCRTDDIGLTEIYQREGVSAVAYSPLAFGVLSGKYHDPSLVPDPKARLVQFKNEFPRYQTPQSHAAVLKYLSLAKDHGLSLTQLALGFAYHRPFMTSTIIGATSLPQLTENIAAWQVRLSPEILTAIEAIHRDHPNPCP